MKKTIKVSLSEFKKIINMVIGIVPSKSALPTAQCILLRIQGNTIFVMANDLISTISYNTEIDNPNDCYINLAIPPQLFMSTINSFNDKEIELMQEDNNIIIITENSRYSIVCYDGKDFPNPESNKSEIYELPEMNLHEFTDAGYNVLFAGSDDELKIGMNGICLKVKGNDLILVATNSHLLAEWIKYDFCQDGECDNLNCELLFPKKAIKQLNTIVGNFNKDSLIKIRYNKAFIFFDFDKVSITSRLSEYKFPAYEPLIPNTFVNEADILKQEFSSILKRLSMYCDKISHTCKFEFKGNLITMEAHDKMQNDKKAVEKMACLYEGEHFVIGYDIKKMLDIVSHIETPEIILKMNTPLSVSILTPSKQEKGTKLTMLLMPIMLEGTF